MRIPVDENDYLNKLDHPEDVDVAEAVEYYVEDVNKLNWGTRKKSKTRIRCKELG